MIDRSATGQAQSLKARIHELYEGSGKAGQHFRYGLFVFDLATIVFIVATSFAPGSDLVETIDVLIGLILLVDLLARFWISKTRWADLVRPTTWADLVALASFLSPIVGEGAGFLRILRTLRLLRTYQFLDRLRRDSRYFRQNEDAILAAVNLVVFIFVMTGIVYSTQVWTNPDIHNYMDALYFTVTSLTTTGFGDITLPGTSGRLISVVIMICGVTLFLRLAQIMFRPHKVRFACPTCNLQRHDPDAVHCKACGTTLNIPDENL